MTDRVRGAMFGLLAALTFGASAPLSKLLLPSARPIVVSALLYLGGAIAILFWARPAPDKEARLTKADVPTLVAITALGGVVGPLLMLLGLERVSGLAGSLLLNL